MPVSGSVPTTLPPTWRRFSSNTFQPSSLASRSAMTEPKTAPTTMALCGELHQDDNGHLEAVGKVGMPGRNMAEIDGGDFL